MKDKATKEDFEYFKRKCELWLEILNLWTWKVYYEFKPLENNIAEVETIYTGRVATIRLNNKSLNVEVTKDILNESALHECLEILLSPLGALAHSRDYNSEDYIKETHMVIRLLEKLLRKPKL